MKNLLITTSLIFSAQLVFSQLVITPDSDTIFWYRYKNEDAFQFSLGRIEDEISDFSFRFWSYGLLVEVTQNDLSNLGEITHFVEEYTEDEPKRDFKKTYEISSTNAKLLIDLIDSLNIKELPTDKNIIGWNQGLDGIEYFIEYKQGNNYTFKNYWTPTAQDGLKEAKELLNFISLMNRLLDLDNSYKTFESEIPFNGWTYPGSGSAVLKTKQKSTKQKKRS
jgi:hypothetical protein